MRVEWLVGLRYLTSRRTSAAPSVITAISISAVAVGVAAMIVVLSVMGGFEGDLRKKILGARAHLLVAGEAEAPLVGWGEVLARVEGTPGVTGAAPFVQSELLISSATNYNGVVLRGIDPDRAGRTSDLPEQIREGKFEWLSEPLLSRDWLLMNTKLPGTPGQGPTKKKAAAPADREDAGGSARLGEETRAALAEIEALDERMATLRARIDGMSAGSGAPEAREGSGRMGGLPSLPVPRGMGAGEGSGPSGLMPALPPPRGVVLSDGSGATSPMPALPAPRGQAAVEGSGDVVGMAPLPPIRRNTRRNQARMDAPGVLIGTELRDSLHVEVGDIVNLVNPEGDLSPSGPIPRSRPFRVVGVFYTGFYEYDSKMVYALLPEAQKFLNLEADRVSGIEARVARMDAAREVRDAVRTRLADRGPGLEVRDWIELNTNLFSALRLEKMAMFVLLLGIVLVAAIAIASVLILTVTEKQAEVAILKSMGASPRGVMEMFIVQGLTIGLLGTLLGLTIGLGLTTWLDVVGWSIDPNVYYIDRLPVEVDPWEVVAVSISSVVLSLLATLLPSVHAAGLEPVTGLRYNK